MPDVIPFPAESDFAALLKIAFEEVDSMPAGATDLIAALRTDMVCLAEQNLKLQQDVRTLAAIVATLVGGGYPNATARKIGLRLAIEIADNTSRRPPAPPAKG